jgi:hypothetical protein
MAWKPRLPLNRRLLQMQPFLKIAQSLPVAALREQLAAAPELWGQHPHRRYATASPHGEMTDIWARYNHPAALADLSTFNSEHDSVWYPCVRKIPAVQELAFRLMTLVQGERLGGVLLTRLPPDASIERHTDTGWHAGYYDKFYVAVQNDPGCVFGFEADDHTHELLAEPGSAFWFRNDVPHWVTNNSSRERLSLIVCIKMRTDPVE